MIKITIGRSTLIIFWKADDEFIKKARNSKDEPIMGPLSANLIEKKKQLEQANLLNSKTMSGFGLSEDPTARLKALVQEQYNTKRKKQSGGLIPLAPLAPIAITALSA